MKRTFLIFALFLPFCAANAQPGSYKNDFNLVRTAIENYLAGAAYNTLHFAPGGVEGSTGCLNDKMATRKMDKLADPLDEFVFYSQLGSQYYEMFYTFSLANQQAFKQCDFHVQDHMEAQHVLYDCRDCNINHILDVSNHMLRLFLSKQDAEPLLNKVKMNVLAMYENVNHDNNTSASCKMGGWLTWEVHNAARAGLDHLNAIQTNNRNSTAGKLGMVMSHFYKNVLALPVQEFNVWASPEWQVGYYAALYSTYLELTNMDFGPHSTAYLDYAAGK
jgi:hypothetical protein